MSITFFGFVWLFLLCIYFLGKSSNGLLFMTLLSTIFQCNNVIEIGELGIGAHVITALSFSIRTMFTKKRNSHCKTSFVFVYSMFLVFISYIFINSLYNNVDNGIFAVIVQLLIYITCAYRIYLFHASVSKRQYVKYVLIVIGFVTFISPVQLLATFGYIPREWLSPFFYNEVGTNVYFHHPEVYRRLLSTFLEPSFCAPFLVGSLFFVFYMREAIARYKIWISILLVELLLTTSSTGYLSLIITLALFFVMEIKNRNTSSLLAIFICCIIFYYCTKDSILSETLFNKLESNSGKFRMAQDVEALSLFLQNPWMGVGYGNARASSMLTTLLAELGCIGVCLFGLVIYALLNPFRSYKENTIKENAAFFFMFSVIISLLIAIPDLQYCVFWFAMYILAMSMPLNSSIPCKKSIKNKPHKYNERYSIKLGDNFAK